MSLSLHDAIVICLDVGKSVSILKQGEDKTFFERSKECVSWIIQRKLISQSPDVLALVLLGSDDIGDSSVKIEYDQICCKFDFQYGSWEMLQYVETKVETTANESDWIGGLDVSVKMLQNYEKYNPVQNKKIVFFSDFTHYGSDDLEAISKNLKKFNISITVIGSQSIVDLINSEACKEPAIKRKKGNNGCSQERLKGEELVALFLKKFLHAVTICSFDGALKQLCSFTRKALRKTPWNCLLDIGDVKINISMFKKTDPKSSKKFDTKYVKTGDEESQANTYRMPSQIPNSDTVSVVRDKVMHYKHEEGDDGEVIDVEVKEEDCIEGYRYGNTIIPFADADKAVMTYKPGPKAFSVIGFTSISSVPFYLLSGECSYIVLPREKDHNAEVALSAIVQAMKKLECLAIVRRVYSNDRGLSLGILYPFIEEIAADETDDEIIFKECLIYIELAFDEEVKCVSFPSLENVAKRVTQEQNDAVDALIDSMDLMSADKDFSGEPCEAFNSSSLHDFKEQLYHYSVIQRGLYPDKPLPSSLPPCIENFIKMPKVIEENMQTALKKVKENFKIDVVKPVENAKEGEKSSQVPEGVNDAEVFHFREESINNEKQTPPFRAGLKKLFVRGFPTDQEMEEFLVENTASQSIKDFEDVISEIRSSYLKRNPDAFNKWLINFKSFCHDKNGFALELWNVIVTNGKLGLISDSENPFSRITEAEADKFLHMEVTKSLSYLTFAERMDSEFTQDSLDELLREHVMKESLARK